MQKVSKTCCRFCRKGVDNIQRAPRATVQRGASPLHTRDGVHSLKNTPLRMTYGEYVTIMLRSGEPRVGDVFFIQFDY